MNFIKLHIVYQSNPTKKATSENDLLMREVYYHACDIVEITPTVPDDESLMAKTHVRFAWAQCSFSVMETAEEILALIKNGDCK
jgi:hypothetical protein